MFEARRPILSSCLSTVTVSSLRDDEGGDAAVAGVLVGLGVDRVPVGVAAVGDEALRAVDHVLVALPDGGRAHARHVRAGVGLGQAEGGELGLLGEHAEVLRLDLAPSRRAAPAPRRARWRRAWWRSRRSPRRAPRRSGSRRGRRRPRRRTRAGSWEFIRPSSQALSMISCGQVRVPVVLPGDRPDLLLREVVGHVADVLLLFGECEINHRQPRFVSGCEAS